MKHSKLVCLPIHVWDREIDSRLLLALMLAKQGATVLFGHEYNLSPLYKTVDQIFHIGAGRPVYDCLRTEKWYKPIINRQGFTGLVYEEGINDLATGSDFHFAGINKKAINSTTNMYGWCSEELKLMQEQTSNIEETIELKKKFKKCLNTRFEILMPHIANNYFKETSDSLRSLFGDYVLLSDNFATESYGNKQKHDQNQNVSRLDIGDKDKRNLANKLSEFMDSKGDARNNFCSIIRNLAKANPHINFIMRPHPTADNRFWHEEFAGIRNIIVLYHDSCEAWILGSLCLIHSGCTMGIQARITGTKCIDVNNLINDKSPTAASTLMADYIPSNFKEITKALNECIALRTSQDKVGESHSFKRLPIHKIISNEAISNVNTFLPSNLQISSTSMTEQICADSLLFFSNSTPMRTFSTESILERLENLPPNYSKSRHESIHVIAKKLSMLNKLVMNTNHDNNVALQSTKSTNVYMLFQKEK